MATVYSYPDSRAVFGRSFGARYAMESEMENLIETALLKARSASDRANAHLEYVTMLTSAGMFKLAEKRRAAFKAESRMAEVYYAVAGELIQ
jgi:hypothetical protein